jgi:Glycosyl hydrolase family 26
MKLNELRRVGLALCVVTTLFVSATHSADPPTARGDALPIGVYRGVNDPSKVDAFANWVGRPVVWGEDFIGWESWSNVSWPTWWLETWSKWVHAKPGRRLILAVPLLAGPVDGSGPTKGDSGVGEPVSLEKGAAGAYNHYFKQLAENLVTHRLGDAILRPGWEFNGDWYPWRAKGKEQALAEYWRQIIKTMRAVPGAKDLKFCWNPTLGDQQFPAEKAWPGDEFVDLVGVDVYDESWMPATYPWPATAAAEEIEARRRRVWKTEILGGAHGLAFWSRFARSHGKPLAVCEWGVKKRPNGHGGGDNPYFVEQMHQFLNDPANHASFHCYFDFNCEPPDGLHQISPGEKGTDKTAFPIAAARFKTLFGAPRPSAAGP